MGKIKAPSQISSNFKEEEGILAHGLAKSKKIGWIKEDTKSEIPKSKMIVFKPSCSLLREKELEALRNESPSLY